MTCDANDPREPGTEIEERDHHSTREEEIRRRAYEIYLERGANLALSWRIGFRPNVNSRLSSAAQSGLYS
jgi:hypothetical protein